MASLSRNCSLLDEKEDYIMRLYGYEFKHEHGHVTIYRNGEFQGTAASLDEAISDLADEEESDN